MKNLKKYGFEFLCIFIAVVSAFALSNWNIERKMRLAEDKILLEISDGLEKDLKDVQLNIYGHKRGIRACTFWRKVLTNQEVEIDSLDDNYLFLTRDFVAIQNVSGYETLKSKGLEIIEDDSLRSEIIGLYEYSYVTLRKLEEEHAELQFHTSYFRELNDVIAPHFTFAETGQITGFEGEVEIPEEQRNILLSYLWRIQVNRSFVLYYYKQVEGKIKATREHIEEYLKD